jgi:hypothetical protein
MTNAPWEPQPAEFAASRQALKPCPSKQLSPVLFVHAIALPICDRPHSNAAPRYTMLFRRKPERIPAPNEIE